MNDLPEPYAETPPEGPGGADAPERDPDDFPLVTPDQPTSAQAEEIPDSIQEPEDSGDAKPIDDAADNGQEEPA